jgi:geranylgeranyl pyrophosphate synthase
MFLNTISILLHSIKFNSTEISLSLFSQFNSDLPSDCILSPFIYIDQWTWLIEKWKIALQTFPINLTKHGAFGRLVRTTIGVGIARLYGFAENNEQDDLDKKFFQSLQMGFYYGVAYALVDGLQDNQYEQQQQKYIDIDKWLIEMERILSGHKLDQTSLPQLPVTSLLLETFHSLVQLTLVNCVAEQTFTDLALLLRSQRSDKKDLEKSYDNDIDLYIGPLMKSHFTYTATAFMGGARMVNDCERLWTMPFLGQLTDDCRDFDEDRQEKSITPVTYYAKHNDSILNPFFVFLFVCEDLYLQSHEDKNTGAFLGRRILRTLRTLKNDLNEFLTIFTLKSYPDLYKYTLSLENLFDRVSDPEKAIFRFVNKFANHYSFNHRKIETFAYDYLPLVEKQLTININNNDPLIRGINHSLKAGGKRLRPLLLLMIAQIYNINIERVLPLARAIEYLHTSSLIFDDLPAQDNAPLRRGQPTLHMPIESDKNDIPPSLTEGRAQLVAVDLIAHAIRLVTVDLNREGFSYESINHVTAELSQSMNQLCHGQFLDLQAARMNKSLTINELDHIAELKTGKAIEIVLICPVILAEQEKSLDLIIERIRELGKLMGILFQMKDDLLDVEGNIDELGKLTNIDQQNQTITYVSLLGIEKTRKRIEKKRKQAELILDDLWPQAGTIRDVIRHICERKK